MSDQKKTYMVVGGYIQKFPDKPAVATREVNDQEVRDFTVRALGSQKLIRVTLWPEFGHAEVSEGDLIHSEGALNVSENNGRTYYSINARWLNVNGERIDANRDDSPQRSSKPASVSTEDAPF